MTIKKGDLVCLYRRKTKGLGIVLNYVEDVGVALDIDVPKVLGKLRSSNNRVTQALEISSMIRRSEHKDLASDFFMYNEGWSTKLKVQFAYVRWFKKPSNYESDTIYADAEWYPAEWLKTLDKNNHKIS
jgi:hypothetical protein